MIAYSIKRGLVNGNDNSGFGNVFFDFGQFDNGDFLALKDFIANNWRTCHLDCYWMILK